MEKILYEILIICVTVSLLVACGDSTNNSNSNIQDFESDEIQTELIETEVEKIEGVYKLIEERYEHIQSTYNHTSYYDYDIRGNCIEIRSIFDDGSTSAQYSYTYDENDNLKTEIYKRISDGFEYEEKTEYEYDDNNNCTKINKYDAEKLTGYDENVYDENCNMISQMYYAQNLSGVYLAGYRLYEYDENGNCVLENWYDSNGNLNICCEFIYDENGNLITEYSNRDIPSAYTYEHHYEYDDNHNKILWLTYNSDGSKGFQCEYVYDEENRLIQMNEFSASGEWSSTMTYKYKEIKVQK